MNTKNASPKAIAAAQKAQAKAAEAKAKKAQDKAAKAEAKPAKPAKTPKEKKPARIDTGYVANIRALLLGGKHTLSQAAKEVQEQYPDKTIDQVKRVAANVAKRMRKNSKHPEWAEVRWVAGQVPSTGYMARIDELLKAGEKTTRQIGETVAEEFGKDVVSAKKVVRARMRRIVKTKGIKLNVPHEADIKEDAEETKPAKPAKTPKADKAPVAAKPKTEAKPAKGKKADAKAK